MNDNKTMQQPEEANNRAKIAANFVREFLFHRHRGVLSCGDRFIVFGNDGYVKDQRSQQQVSYLRDRLKALDLYESGFSADDQEGYSWALLINNYQGLEAEAELEAAVWEGWQRACRMHPADQ
jgi:hypothetical protein